MWGVSSRPVWPLEIRAKEHGSITRLVLWHDILKKKVNLSLHFRISQLLTLAHLIVSKTQKHRVGQATVSPVLNFQQLGQSWPLNVTLTVRLVSYWNLSIIPQVQLKKSVRLLVAHGSWSFWVVFEQFCFQQALTAPVMTRAGQWKRNVSGWLSCLWFLPQH